LVFGRCAPNFFFMRAIAIFVALGLSPLCRAEGPFDFARVKMPAPRRAGAMERFFRRLTGGDQRHLTHPDGTVRHSERPLGTVTVRWKTSF
jgi:hypothetical protein